MTNEGGKGKIIKRADPSTIQDKFLVGYQGWFTCGGDGEPVGPGHHGWLHWMNCPIPDGGHPNVDLWPDVSEYSPSELFPVPGMTYPSGEQVFLFSSRHPKTVQRHFNWMAKHGVDGAFLQRFTTEVDVDAGSHGIRRIRDEVGQRVREAAEKEGRVFAIMYDVTGLPADRVLHVIQQDWTHLIRDQGLLDSPNYLREKRKAVVALWGFGFDSAGHSPALVREVCNFIYNQTPGGAYIVGGVPTFWRTHCRDADRNPGFVDVWMNHFDAISPWTIGRYKDEDEADRFTEVMKGDVEFIKRNNDRTEISDGKKIDYIPVVFPGGSGYNMTQGKWEFNGMKRNGGKFLWKQIANARRLGVRIMYGAMWDEYDEGTAFMPVIEKKRLLPRTDKFPFLALDEDGYDIPSDWYMRICGFAAEGLRSERRIHDSFPSKELQDYWSSRPKYEEVDVKCGDFVSGSSSGAGSGGGEGQTYQDWLAVQKEKEDGPPPPPYTLEADEQPVSQSQQHTPIPTSPSTQVRAPSHPGYQQPAQPQSYVAPQSSSDDNHTPSQAAGALHALAQSVNSNLAQASHQPYAPSGSTYPSAYPQSQPHPLGNDPVSSLANDFGRQTISPGPDSDPNPAPMSPNLQSRPPLHPSHPSAQTQPRPPPRPPSQHSRPQTTSPTPTSPTPSAASFTHHQNLPPAAAASPSPWAQAQWPPSEWQANRPTQSTPQTQQPYHPSPQQSHQPPHQQSSYSPSPYPNQGEVHQGAPSGLGASLSRPNSYSAGYGQQHNRPPTRPHASSYGPGAVIPGSSSSPNHSQPQSPTFNAPSGYPDGPSHSTYPGQASSSGPPNTYPDGPSQSTYPGQTSFGPPPGGLSSYHTPPAGGPSFPSIPTIPSTYGPPPGSSPGFGAPNAGNGVSYPGQSTFPSASYPSISIPTDPSAQSQSSYGQPGSMAGPSFPEVGKPADTGHYNVQYPVYKPPPMPPRPPTASQNSGTSFPAPSTSGALGFALNAVDRVAGRETRAQLENLAQSGTKLFKKITR